MTRSAAPERDSLALWCGWVLVGAAALTPLLGWLAPLGFAPLVALMGLLTLPAFRITDEDRPAAIALFAGLIWAAVSTLWSPYQPDDLEGSTALKLALQLPLYWCAVCAARRADPALRRLAGVVLAWGMAAFGLLLVAESATGAAIYRTLHEAFYEPIRPDLAASNVGHATFVLALLWPLAALGARERARRWLALAMVAGVAAAALAFGSDAPAMALVLSGLAGVAAYRWPQTAPKALAWTAAVLFLVMPLIVWSVREFADLDALGRALPPSWAQRMSYWSHAVDWISDRPLRGWGLDASRAFGPGIQLHPHDAPLQVWLELGVVGAVAAAVFWGVTLMRLVRPRPDLAAAAAAAAAAAYLLFGGVNFGVWQEWWLALGALAVAFAGMLGPLEAPIGRRSAARPST